MLIDWHCLWWACGGSSVFIDAYLFEAHCMSYVMTFSPSMYSFEIEIVYLWDHSECSRTKRGYHLSFLPIQNRCHASGQILSLVISHSFLLYCLDFGFSGQWSGWRNCFWQSWLLTMALQPHSLPFHTQVMILVGSYRFFNCTSTSVDGCYLYNIIHNSTSQWD